MTAAKMDVASNDDSLTEIGRYFAIFIFADSYRENWKTAKISAFTVFPFTLKILTCYHANLRLVIVI